MSYQRKLVGGPRNGEVVTLKAADSALTLYEEGGEAVGVYYPDANGDLSWIKPSGSEDRAVSERAKWEGDRDAVRAVMAARFGTFRVVCQCGSDVIEWEDTRGWSALSGGWGEVSLTCLDCGESHDIIDERAKLERLEQEWRDEAEELMATKVAANSLLAAGIGKCADALAAVLQADTGERADSGESDGWEQPWEGLVAGVARWLCDHTDDFADSDYREPPLGETKPSEWERAESYARRALAFAGLTAAKWQELTSRWNPDRDPDAVMKYHPFAADVDDILPEIRWKKAPSRSGEYHLLPQGQRGRRPMKTVIFRRVSHWERIPLTYRPIQDGGRTVPAIVCECGVRSLAKHHGIQADGTLVGSVGCPAGCGFHVWGRLESWPLTEGDDDR